jgi:hypothetical protein
MSAVSPSLRTRSFSSGTTPNEVMKFGDRTRHLPGGLRRVNLSARVTPAGVEYSMVAYLNAFVFVLRMQSYSHAFCQCHILVQQAFHIFGSLKRHERCL